MPLSPLAATLLAAKRRQGLSFAALAAPLGLQLTTYPIKGGLDPVIPPIRCSIASTRSCRSMACRSRR